MKAGAAALAVGLSAGAAFAESPLSALGYGWVQPAASVRAAGMGMVTLGSAETLGLNPEVPAFWRGAGDMARFFLGGGYEHNTAQDAAEKVRSDGAGLRGMGLAWPLGRSLSAGVTLTPLTRMDYRWKRTASGTWTAATEGEEGVGGLSQALAAVSFPLRNTWRGGAGIRAVFGNIYRQWGMEFPGTRSDSASSVSHQTSRRYAGLGWHLSWEWDLPPDWHGGALMAGPVRAKVQRRNLVTAGGVTVIDETRDLEARAEIPWEAALGVSRRLWGRHWAAAEVAYKGWGDAGSSAGSGTEAMTGAARWSLGWEWVPEFRTFDPVWRSLTYRAGAYVQQGYFRSPSGHTPGRAALTAGASVPYNHRNSRLDFAVELGWTGSSSRDLVGERTVGVSLGFNHSETWFVGRRKS